MNIRFEPKDGARLTQQQAERYGTRITSLSDQHGGHTTAPHLVNDARSGDSPLHDYFEWDDEEAAEQYREHQAQYLLRNIVVRTLDEDGEPGVSVRAFVNVKTVKDGQVESSFVPIRRAVDDENMRQQVRERLINRLTALRRQLGEFDEFAELCEAIDLALAVA